MKNKKELLQMEKELRKLPLWKLTIFTAEIEDKIKQLKMQGESSDTPKMKGEKWKRNAYRHILFEKLKRWTEGEDMDKMTYSSIIEGEKYETSL